MTILPKSRYFPPAEYCDEEGVVLFGGELTSEWLIDAYAHGIFPWPIFEGADLMLWWSPDPRAVLEPHEFHVSRRLRQTLQSHRFGITSDCDFEGVIRGCAGGDRAGNTWLTPAMIESYLQLHRQGHAHSVEVWHEGQLVGGVYGVALGGAFAGESMFHRMRDASKVALAYLSRHLIRRGFQLFDIQQLTSHTASLGAKEIPRRRYLTRLRDALLIETNWGALDSEWRRGDLGRDEQDAPDARLPDTESER